MSPDIPLTWLDMDGQEMDRHLPSLNRLDLALPEVLIRVDHVVFTYQEDADWLPGVDHLDLAIPPTTRRLTATPPNTRAPSETDNLPGDVVNVDEMDEEAAQEQAQPELNLDRDNMALAMLSLGHLDLAGTASVSPLPRRQHTRVKSLDLPPFNMPLTTIVSNNPDLVFDNVTKLPLDMIIAKEPRPYGSALIVPGIVHVNGEMAPAYDKRTALSIGKTFYLGLRTDIVITQGEFQVPSIQVKAHLESTTRTYRAFDLVIPCNSAEFLHTYERRSAADREAMFPTESPSYSCLDPTPAADIPAQEVDMLCISVPRSDVRFSLARTFVSDMRRLGQEYDRIALDFEQFAARVESSNTLQITLSRPTDASDSMAWPDLKSDIYPADPFASLRPDGVSIKDITGTNIELPKTCSDCLYPQPVPTTSVFFSQDHRYLTLLLGVCDEVRFENLRQTTGAETDSLAKFFPLPSAWHEPDAAQLANYGQLVADGLPTEAYMIVQITPGNKNLLGDIGDKVTVTTKAITAASHPQPNPNDAHHITRVATDLMARYQGAVNHAQSVVYEQRQAAVRAHNDTLGPDEDEITDVSDFDQENEIYDNAVFDQMRGPISGFITQAMANAWTQDHPPEAAMSSFTHYLHHLVVDLGRGNNETDDAYLARLQQWVREHPPVDGENRHGDRGLTFHGRRVAPPTGVTLHHAIYHVFRPRQPGYSKAYKAPYLGMQFPATEFPEKVKNFSEVCFPTPGQERRDEDADQSSTTTPANAVIVQVSVKPSITTANHEMKALHSMKQIRSGSDGDAFWDYSQHFQHFPVTYERNLFSVLPGLLDIPETSLSPALRHALEHSKAGKIIISGCPGSGKSTAAVTIVMAALTKRFYPRGQEAQARSPPGLSDETHRELQEHLEGDDPDKPFADANLQVQIPHTAPSQPTPPPRRGFVLHAETQPVAVAPVPGRRTTVLWIAPANSIVDDALQRFIRKEVDVARLYTFSSEMANLMRPPAEKQTELTITTSGRQTVNRLFTEHRNEAMRVQEQTASAHNDVMSLSNRAQAHFQADERVTLLDAVRELFVSDPHAYAVQKEAATNAARTLLQDMAKIVDVLCCTPVAARTLGNNTDYVPSMIIADETGRMTEAQFFLGVEHWPHTTTFILGDPQQFQAVVPSKHTVLKHEKKAVWADRFGAQREISLIQRAEDNNAVDVYLRENHRAHGGIIAWCSRRFYRGEMVLARQNKALHPAQLMLLQYFRQFSPDIRMCGLFIDIGKMHETKVASSWSSPTTARFCVELAITLWRTLPLPRKHDHQSRFRILIITGYAVQASDMRYMVKRISANCVPPGAIEVRTVDDSPSHEAEITIVDFPRKSAVGFLDEPKRMTVASSRANYCTIYVGRADTFKSSPLLQSLVTLHKDALALLTVSDSLEWCTRCFNYGHSARTCKDVLGADGLVCQACDQKDKAHSGRDCRRPRQVASFDIDEVLPALDNIVRSPLALTNPEEVTKHEQRELNVAHDSTEWVRTQKTETAVEQPAVEQINEEFVFSLLQAALADTAADAPTPTPILTTAFVIPLLEQAMAVVADGSSEENPIDAWLRQVNAAVAESREPPVLDHAILDILQTCLANMTPVDDTWGNTNVPAQASGDGIGWSTTGGDDGWGNTVSAPVDTWGNTNAPAQASGDGIGWSTPGGDDGWGNTGSAPVDDTWGNTNAPAQASGDGNSTWDAPAAGSAPSPW